MIDVATFRLVFPAFANPAAFPDAYIEAQWTAATAYIDDADGPLLSGVKLARALDLLTAHLMQLNVTLASGGDTPTVGAVTNATVDKVTIGLAPPPTGTSGWKFWLSSTPYGVSLWALLATAVAGGPYIGGSAERRGFRKIGGGF